MSGRVGSITTDIIVDGLVFNMDAANRASTIPSTGTNKAFNTIGLAESGSFINDTMYDSSTITPTFAFDGTNDYIMTNFNPSGYTNFTYSAWIKQTTTNSQTVWWDFGSGGNKPRFYSWTGNIAYFQIASSTNYATKSSWNSGISDNTWFNLTVTFNGNSSSNADKLKVYINSSQQSLSFNGTIESVMPTNSQDVAFGIMVSTLNYDFNGNMGPIQMYNSTLSANEVLHNYNALKSRFGL